MEGSEFEEREAIPCCRFTFPEVFVTLPELRSKVAKWALS
jgi:hypothetical protein